MLNSLKWIIVIPAFIQCACNGPADSSSGMRNHLDSTDKKIETPFKPGFGDFMSTIQVHHSKLWFAGLNQNWPLAELEIHELAEAITNIQGYQLALKESKHITMMKPALDSVNFAIKDKNIARFKSGYILLTDACNQCHRLTNMEFNVVKIPDSSTYINQDFKSNP